MANLIDFSVEDLTIPYKAPNGILKIYLNVENIDLVEIIANTKLDIKIDNNVIYPENKIINNNYEFNINIERENFPSSGVHIINIVAKTYNFEYNETLEHTITKEIEIQDSYPEENPRYYIDITANINSSLSIQNNSIIYYGKKISKSRNSKYNISYNLPTGTKTISIGNINAIDPNEQKLGVFSPTLTIIANSDGTSNALVNIAGDNVIATIEDDPLKTQKVYWGNNKPTITHDDPDVLTNILEPRDVRNEFKNEIDTIEDLYSVSIIKEWEFNILPVKASVNSIPNVLDAYAEIKRRIYPYIFLEGEHIILETAYPYNYTIQDFDGEIQTIIESTPIYARITHSDSAPTI